MPKLKQSENPAEQAHLIASRANSRDAMRKAITELKRLRREHPGVDEIVFAINHLRTRQPEEDRGLA